MLLQVVHGRTDLLQRLKEVCGHWRPDARRDVASKLRLCVQHCYGLSNLYQNLSSQEAGWLDRLDSNFY